MNKKLPIGISDFKNVIDTNCYYIDKSLLVKEIFDDGSKVILLPRPRRFGKTINMTMLRYFFEKSNESNSYLFENLSVWDHEECRDRQGKYPVIYLTLKDVKCTTWEECFVALKEAILDIFRSHKYVLENNILDDSEQKEYRSILNKTAINEIYPFSLKNLSIYLEKYHKKKVIILIDEYDVPIMSGYSGDYYTRVIDFMRTFLCAALKDNPNLEKAVLTGILRIAKESIFSGLNNLNVYTLLDEKYSDKFGLLEKEVESLFNFYNIAIKSDELKKWYNGYIFGKNVIYNPWSIMNYANKWQKGFAPYWINTSDNAIVKQIVINGGEDLKQEIESLIKGDAIIKRIDENVVMGDLNHNSEVVWSLLLFSGYLKAIDMKLNENGTYCTLQIPNVEVKYLYKEIIINWFSEKITSRNFELMLKALVTGDIDTFEEIFKDYVLKTFSCFDAGGEAERVYHTFVLGMLIALSDSYEVNSDKESAYGRYDVMLIPKDTSKLGIVMEFKKVRRKDTLKKTVESALMQIEVKQYETELLKRGVNNILKLGIAFKGKNVMIMQRP